jgi:hypothetical protein
MLYWQSKVLLNEQCFSEETRFYWQQCFIDRAMLCWQSNALLTEQCFISLIITRKMFCFNVEPTKETNNKSLFSQCDCYCESNASLRLEVQLIEQSY